MEDLGRLGTIILDNIQITHTKEDKLESSIFIKVSGISSFQNPVVDQLGRAEEYIVSRIVFTIIM